MFFELMMFMTIFLISKNYMTLSFLLISLTTFIIMNLMTAFNWSAYIIFLVFMGGVMILFMYIISLMKDEKLNNKLILLIPILMLLYVNSNKKNFYMEKILIFNHSFLSLTIVIYLFIILMMVMKIIYFNKTPLRKMN